MQKKESIKKNTGRGKSLFFRASAEEFSKIPGSPIAYWVDKSFRELFTRLAPLSDFAEARVGLMTSDNDLFLRFYWEVEYRNIKFNSKTSLEAVNSNCRWFPHNKGGGFRKWVGNYEYLVDWENNGERIKDMVVKKYPYLKGNPNFVVHDDGHYFLPSISWSEITSSLLAFRVFPEGFTYNIKGMCAFPKNECTFYQLIALCNNKYVQRIANAMNPTLSFGVKNFSSIPSALLPNSIVISYVKRLLKIAKIDWDSLETSWDFKSLPLLHPYYRSSTLSNTFKNLRSNWLENTLEMQHLEEENNRIFIDTYGLQVELTPEVPLSEITLTCNPYYRYKGDRTEAELEALLLADTMKELISYAVGCMFGRYSLDKPGLILANQGETIEDYLAQIQSPAFSADDDNVIPILDGDWFSDDVTERFFKFLHVTFGDEHYEDNLQFIENAIGKNIRKYFLKDFYKDHVRRYKKRPIYWMFSSSKGSFNVLIYMHRYRPDTVSVILNGYLREFRAKLSAKLAHLKKVGIGTDSSKSEKVKAIKEIEKLKKIITEVEDYERDILYPLATEQMEIDLDDGVKVNYNKFGTALKKITGLTEKGN